MANLQQIGRNGTAVATSHETRRETPFVELDGRLSFFPFTAQEWKQRFKYLYALLSSDLCNEKIAMLFGILPVAGSVVVEGQSEEVAHGFDRPGVSHLDSKREDVSGGFLPSTGSGSLNRDAAFSINQSSKVSKFVGHVINGRTNDTNHKELFAKKSANSVDTPRGQYRASSGVIDSVGVCREHRPNPKGMMCSDLGSNVKRAAEMTSPAVMRVTTLPENQDAEVATILWYGAAGVTNRRKHGVLSDINTTLTS